MNATVRIRRMHREVLRFAALFGVVGPALGLMCFFIPILLAQLADGEPVTGPYSEEVHVLPIMAYMFGVVPAAATGAVAGRLRRMRPRWFAVLCITLTGAVTSGALGAAFGRSGGVLFFAVLGAFSALVLALLFTRRVREQAPGGGQDMTRRRLAWKGALLFGAFGPGVALLLLLIVTVASNLANGEAVVSTDMGLVVFLGLPFAYLIGTLPAGITGAIAGVLRPRLVDWPLVAVVTAVGATLAVAVSPIIGEGSNGTWLLGSAGACGAFVMTLQFIRWTRPHAPGASPAT